MEEQSEASSKDISHEFADMNNGLNIFPVHPRNGQLHVKTNISVVHAS